MTTEPAAVPVSTLQVIGWARGPRVRETLSIALLLIVFTILMALRPDALFLAGCCFIGGLALLSLVRAWVYAFGDNAVFMLDDEGVRWRSAPLRRKFQTLAWRDIRVVQLNRVRIGRGSEQAIILVRKPPLGALSQTGKTTRDPVVIVRGLDHDPEAVLDAFRRYVFAQDLRDTPH